MFFMASRNSILTRVDNRNRSYEVYLFHTADTAAYFLGYSRACYFEAPRPCPNVLSLKEVDSERVSIQDFWKALKFPRERQKEAGITVTSRYALRSEASYQTQNLKQVPDVRETRFLEPRVNART